MIENELIKNLKQLKQIKPNQDWVVFSKTQILGQETESKNPSIVSVFQTLFKKPAYATITVALLLVVGIAGFLFLIDKEKPAQIVEVPEKIVYTDPAPEKEIIVALGDLQKGIEQTTERLKIIKNPEGFLQARNDIVPTIEVARSIVVETKKIEQVIDTETKQDRILAVNTSIDEFENSVDGLEKTLNNTGAKIANQLIQYLETRTLTEVQQEILEKAKQAYQDGDYNIALINAMHVSQLDR